MDERNLIAEASVISRGKFFFEFDVKKEETYMNDQPEEANTTRGTSNDKETKNNVSRRKFIKSATTAAAVATTVTLEPLFGGKASQAEASVISYDETSRASSSKSYRVTTAKNEDVNPGVFADNGDKTLVTDFSALYSKALPHDGLGVPNGSAYQSFENALQAGTFAALQNITVGTPGGGPNSLENGPAGAFALDLEGRDSHAVPIPFAPSVASNQTADEQVEHYWAALLRDVPFDQYGSNSIAAQAVSDMNNLSFLKSSSNNQFPFPVTAGNLFRGRFQTGDGNVMGPYVSQFLVQPTMLGASAISGQIQTFQPNQAFMTTQAAFLNIANGGPNQGSLSFDATPRYIRNGRDLAAYTHVDTLYQAYLVAFLVLAQIGAPLNPGNPYGGSQTQKAFGTLGGPDAAGTLAEMATRALKGAWFHKWIVNLRLRPEEYGALVQANLTKTSPVPQASQKLHGDVFSSAVLPLINQQFGSFLLPQAFPEGSPTHPCYPTGHGSVAGACITAIKFFFDGTQFIQPLLTNGNSKTLPSGQARNVFVPSDDGLSLNNYTGSDAGNLTINGELNKLAWNVSVGHGIHAGIHFRSSTYESILMGEEVALAILRDRALSYSEPFAVTITKFDGTTTLITNESTKDSSGTNGSGGGITSLF